MFAWCLVHDDVRGDGQDRDGGDHSEGGEEDQAQPVHHLHSALQYSTVNYVLYHGSKLPVRLDGAGLVIVPDLGSRTLLFILD